MIHFKYSSMCNYTTRKSLKQSPSSILSPHANNWTKTRIFCHYPDSFLWQQIALQGLLQKCRNDPDADKLQFCHSCVFICTMKHFTLKNWLFLSEVGMWMQQWLNPTCWMCLSSPPAPNLPPQTSRASAAANKSSTGRNEDQHCVICQVCYWAKTDKITSVHF